MTFEERLLDLIEHSDLIYGETRAGRNTNQRVGLLGKKVAALLEDVDQPLAKRYLSRLTDDQAQGLITFLQGIKIGEFIPGMFGGKGAQIDKDGNMEATSLRLRAMLEVPELRFNRLTVVGDELILTESGFIESVQHLEGDVYQLNMKLEEGENIALVEHDLVKGIFHYESGEAGFSTGYMRVTEVGLSFIKVILAANEDTPTNANFPPMPFMKIARVGNPVDPDRQRYIVASSKLGGFQIYDGASTFKNATLVGSMDTAQSFKNIYPNLPLREGLFYMYAAGLVVQDIIRVDYQGVAVREIFDRGPWESGRTYYNNDTQGTDDVWHLGCRWRCFSSSTTAEPGWTSPHWIMIEGRSDARMEIVSSHGFMLPGTFTDVVFTPYVFIGNTDVSADIVLEQWRWTRETDNEVADTIWNVQHKEMRALTLSSEDMGTNWSRSNPTRFTCTAIYPASSINPIQFILEF